jgi:hypothetical protein
MTSTGSKATARRTSAAPQASPVLDALGAVGSGTALVVTSAPWWAVMTTGLILATLQAVIVLVPTWNAHRRAMTADVLADGRQRALIALKAADADVTSDDLRACGPGAA